MGNPLTAAWRARIPASRTLLALTAALAAAAALAAELPAAADLRQDGALVERRQQPVLIMFSMPNCIYCPEVRNNYLVPLARQQQGEPGPIVREVDITSENMMLDFTGERLSAKEFSRRYKVRATPTVILLDGHGKLLAEPLVGSGMGGFYGGYLDAALEQARAALKPGKRT